MVTYQASYKLAAPVHSRSLSVSTKTVFIHINGFLTNHHGEIYRCSTIITC